MHPTVTPVLLCGGSGTRLWPASRETMPEQFISLSGRYSPFQQMLLRVRDRIAYDRPLVVARDAQRFPVDRQLAEIGVSAMVLLGPSARNSGPAIFVGCLQAAADGAYGAVSVIASDHAIEDEEASHALPPVASHAVARAFATRREAIGSVLLDAAAYGEADPLSIDHAVMEPTPLAAVLPAQWGWSDIGMWRAPREVGDEDDSGNMLAGAPERLGGLGRLAGPSARAGILAAALACASPAVATPVAPDVTRAGPQDIPCPAGALRIGPRWPIQDAVDRAPPGAIFCIGAGRHRGQTVAPKDGQRFVGEPGAVLDGTVDVTGFTREGRFWVAAAPGPRVEPYGECLATAPACSRPEIVLLDGAPLERVLDDLDLLPGTFTIDGAQRIKIVDDPHGHRVAASAAAYAFLPNGAKDVTVANLTVERYGNPAQHGAVYADHDPRATGWVVEHNDVRLNSGLGILAGPGSRVRANRVETNGQLGISAATRDESIEGNVVAGNGTRGFNPEWEAGGVKTAVDAGLVVRGNHIHGNHGPGLWCDIDCHGILYEGNLVEDNDGPGIFYEISHSAVIRGNIARGNGVVSRQWIWRANIVLAASEDVVIENNLVVVQDGGTGIALIDQGRRRETGGLYRTAGNRIVNNEVRFLGRGYMGGLTDVKPGSPNDGVIETGGNLFDYNSYVWAPGSHVVFAWGRAITGFDGFKVWGQDRNSTAAAAGSD